jgi:hypothetical protein
VKTRKVKVYTRQDPGRAGHQRERERERESGLFSII